VYINIKYLLGLYVQPAEIVVTTSEICYPTGILMGSLSLLHCRNDRPSHMENDLFEEVLLITGK
ncbi:hypothetical protein C7B76_03485, partial [filamentous cyanobacterium CCP2]